MLPFAAIIAEATVENYRLLPEQTEKFLKSIKLGFSFRWVMLEADPAKYEINYKDGTGSSKEKIELAFQPCFSQVNGLEDGLGKYAGLLYKSLRCRTLAERADLLVRAKEQAEQIAASTYPEFSSSIFFDVGNGLAQLESYEKALASYDKAIEFKADFYGAWNNRGNALEELERFEEAIASYDKALEIKPDYPDHWSMRGLLLSRLDHYDEARANQDQALKLQPEYPLWWANRGIVLARSGRYGEALVSCDKAVELQSNDESGYYGKACCYALQGDVDLAIENLQQAINLNPSRCRREAKKNRDFDSIRGDERFQALLQEQTN